MPDTTPDLLALYDAIESGEEAGDRAAFLDALEARDTAVRTAAITEAADAVEAWTGDPTPGEDRPGYDGPTIDPEDRLRAASDPDLPPDLRDQFIAEHRRMVIDEIATELRRLAAASAAATPTPQEG